MKADLMCLQDARDNFGRGNDLITTSCLRCRFKPSYIDAIPLFKNAAEKFHGLGKYDEEICCRLKLTECFRGMQSPWEEGNEYDKMAQVYLKQLNRPLDAFNTVCNCHNSFVVAREFESSIKVIAKISNEFYERKEIEYAERLLKIGFDCILKYFHVLIFDKEASHSSIYRLIEQYIDILYFLNKIDEATESAEKIIKVMENEEEDKSKVIHCYCIMMIGFIILGKETEYYKIISLAQDLKSNGANDDGDINLIDGLYEGMKKGIDDKKLNSKISNLANDFPINVSKVLKNKAKTFTKKEEIIDTGASGFDEDLK